MRLILVLALVAACSKPNPNCERAVGHVFALLTEGPPGSKPHADEQSAIDQIAKAALDQCTREGLSDAQRDCVLGAKSLTDRGFITCPALVEKPPTWIREPIGHPEVLNQLDELRKQNDPAVDDVQIDDEPSKLAVMPCNFAGVPNPGFSATPMASVVTIHGSSGACFLVAFAITASQAGPPGVRAARHSFGASSRFASTHIPRSFTTRSPIFAGLGLAAGIPARDPRRVMGAATSGPGRGRASTAYRTASTDARAAVPEVLDRDRFGPWAGGQAIDYRTL